MRAHAGTEWPRARWAVRAIKPIHWNAGTGNLAGLATSWAGKPRGRRRIGASRPRAALGAAIASLLFAAAAAQELPDDALVDALRAGGYVIVMRHASSPRTQPDVASVAPGNVNRERQLDGQGRDTARAMGEALRRLGIPVGEVLCSPTFRAMETAQLLNLADPEPIDELGDGGQGMRQDSEGTRSAWLRSKAAETIPAGTNRVIITHLPNLLGAFGDAAMGMADGESLIVKPEGGSTSIAARVEIERWPQWVTD